MEESSHRRREKKTLFVTSQEDSARGEALPLATRAKGEALRADLEQCDVSDEEQSHLFLPWCSCNMGGLGCPKGR